MKDFENGRLTLNLDNPDEKQMAVSMSFMQNNASGSAYRAVMDAIPQLPGFKSRNRKTQMKKMEFAFDLISNLEKSGYKIVSQKPIFKEVNATTT